MTDIHKTGLVLEGGGLRGIYTAGILDVLMENNINVDGIVGVSAGAVFGCNYKSGQVGRALRYNKKYCRDPRYMSLRSLIKTGDLFGADFCYREIAFELDPFDSIAFENNPCEFFAVVTEVSTGNPLYLRLQKGDANDIEILRASASMPIVSRPVDIGNDNLCLDGGIADSIPVDWFRSQGYDRVIVVLTRPLGYRKSEGKANPAMSFALRKMPLIAARLKNRSSDYNKTLDHISRLNSNNEILVIAPSETIEISRAERNPETIQRQYDLGRTDAVLSLSKIKNFLSGEQH